jgi:hypothetical protein
MNPDEMVDKLAELEEQINFIGNRLHYLWQFMWVVYGWMVGKLLYLIYKILT